MTAKYHVNSETGDAGLCRAEHGKCPFGSADEHYDSPLKARDAFEQAQSGSFIKHVSGFARKMFLVGGMSVVAVSLAGCTTIGTQSPDLNDAPVVNEPAVTQPVDEGWVDKANEWVEEHPVTTPSDEEIERWLDEKTNKLEEWLKNNGLGSEPSSPVTYDTDGIYFQGQSLNVDPARVAEAERTLSILVNQPEYDDGNYNRAEQFGRSFNTGVAGAVEHRDVPNAVFKNDSPQARVVTGTFIDPYTGLPVQVTGGSSYDADIDHILPLKEAYESGANNWTNAERKAFANDMNNLVYTESGVNRSKGDKDAAQWTPSYEPSQCIYAVKTIEIRGQYNLTIDSAEKAALQQIIDTKCQS